MFNFNSNQMRNKVLLLFIIISITCNAQNLDGFFGIKFGSTREQVKSIMLERKNGKIDLENCSEKKLIFDNVKFAGRMSQFVLFSFVNNKFHTAKVIIKEPLESKVVDVYNDIKTELNTKYFKTTDDFENYKSPYEKGDGYTETAIKVGKLTIAAYWTFKNPNSDAENLISLEIDEKMLIKIGYQDGLLIKEAVNIKNKENFSDY